MPFYKVTLMDEVVRQPSKIFQAESQDEAKRLAEEDAGGWNKKNGWLEHDEGERIVACYVASVELVEEHA